MPNLDMSPTAIVRRVLLDTKESTQREFRPLRTAVVARKVVQALYTAGYRMPTAELLSDYQRRITALQFMLKEAQAQTREARA